MLTQLPLGRFASCLAATVFLLTVAVSCQARPWAPLAAVGAIVFGIASSHLVVGANGHAVDRAMAALRIEDAGGARHTADDLASDLDPVPPVTTPDHAGVSIVSDADLTDEAIELGEAFELYLHALNRHPDLDPDELAEEVADAFRHDEPPDPAGTPIA